MASQDYVLDGSRRFVFPFPVRDASDLRLQLFPGGVVPQEDYVVTGAGPASQGVTIDWPGAPTNDDIILGVFRETPAERVTDFPNNQAVSARALNAEFDNIYQSVVDFQTAFETLEPIYNRLNLAANPGFVAVSDGNQMVLKQAADIEVGEFNALIGDLTDGELLQVEGGVITNRAPGTGSNRVPLNSDLDERGFAQSVESIESLRDASFPETLQRIWLSGYYGVGTAGGGPLYRDDESTEDDNGGTVFVDGDGVRWKRPLVGLLYATWFGVSSKRSKDENSHGLDALSAAAVDGDTAVLAEGTCKLARNHSFDAGVSVISETEHSVLDFSDAENSSLTENTLLKFSGSLEPLPSLSTSAGKGTNEIAFNSDHGLDEGDVVVIYDPSDFSYSGFQSQYRAGEFGRVYRVIDSTSVQLENSLYASYAAADVDLYVLVKKSKAIYKGFTVNPPENDPRTGVEWELTQGFCVENVTSKGWKRSGVSFSRCFDFKTDRLKAESRTFDEAASTEYGIVISNSQRARINGHFIGKRRPVAMGGSDVLGGVPTTDVIISGIAEQPDTFGDPPSGQQALDFRGNVRHCYYKDITLWGRSGGLFIGGQNNGYQNVRGFVGEVAGGMAVRFRELHGMNHLLKDIDLTVYGTGNDVIDGARSNNQISPDTVEAGQIRLENVRINAVEADASNRDIIRISNDGYTGEWTVLLSNVRIHTAGNRYGIVIVTSGDGVMPTLTEFRGQLDLQYSTSRFIPGSDYSSTKVRGLVESGVASVTADSGQPFVDKTVTYQENFPKPPRVILQQEKGYIGSSWVMTAPTSVSEDDYNLRVGFADSGSTFPSSDVVEVGYEAKLEER